MRSAVILSISLGLLAASCSGAGSTNEFGPDGSTSGDDGGGGGDGSAGGDGSSGGDGSTGRDGGGGNDGGGGGDGDGDGSASDAAGNHDSGGGGDSGGSSAIKTVFLIMMENHNWSSIKGSASAPYINGTLLSAGAHAENYFDNPSMVHPSEPNYIWLESGSNLGITTDSNPSVNHQSTTQHLVTLLAAANVPWRTYVEGITGATCPLTASGLYAPKHTPMLFFDDVVGNPPSTSNATCIAHVRPYTQLATDLAGNSVARYNFITPNLCNDMHNSTGCATTDAVKNGDTWLSTEVPKILNSAAYQNGGAIFITWDESEGGEFPIGMIVLSSKAKVGYAGSVRYYHSSMLRTVQEIFGVTPLLNDAANQPSLGDLFTSFP